jgi:hypothetical protein
LHFYLRELSEAEKRRGGKEHGTVWNMLRREIWKEELLSGNQALEKVQGTTCDSDKNLCVGHDLVPLLP